MVGECGFFFPWLVWEKVCLPVARNFFPRGSLVGLGKALGPSSSLQVTLSSSENPHLAAQLDLHELIAIAGSVGGMGKFFTRSSGTISGEMHCVESRQVLKYP